MMKGFLTALALIFVTSAAFAADTPMLADRHVKAGVKCESCHGSDQAAKGPRTVKKETCLACHGGTYAKLAEKTDSLEVNPHDSHLGEIECTKCHRGHQKPVLECARCHDFSKELHIK
uniref:cytochrome c3 family protein n=1 Tax=Mesosutterella multiformis TaxID=2259133 RepID=UPI004028465F